MAEDPPNILVIMADQLDPRMTGAYGHPSAITPHIDRLAADGTVFTNAYTSCPICAPARNSMMTGQYVSDIGCNDNCSVLSSEEPAIGHYMSLAGYDSALSGKMHFTGPDQVHGFKERLTTDVYPADFAWLFPRDESLSTSSAGFHDNPIAIDYTIEGAGVRQWSLQLDYDEETHYRAVEYLRRKRTSMTGSLQKKQPQRDATPFMLVASYQHPHEPFHCLQRHWDLYAEADIPIPAYPDNLDACESVMDRWINQFHGCDRIQLKTEENLKNLHRSYLASATYFDEKVGELMHELELTGLKENTVVILLSDHGDMLGHRGMVQKRCFYEPSSRIPLIIHFPEILRPRNQIRHWHGAVSIVDVLPTLLDMVGSAPATPVGGRSLLKTCEGRGDTDRIIFCENHVEGVYVPCFMAKQGDLKYILIHGRGEQLFDLEKDPAEWRNLAEDPAYASKKKLLRDAILERFDPDAINCGIKRSITRRKVVRDAMNRIGGPSWDFQPFFDETDRYWHRG